MIVSILHLLKFIAFHSLKYLMSKKQAPSPVAKAPEPAKSKNFDAKAWAKNGVSEEEVTACKQAFDLFDTDQGGSIDIKGTE